MAFLIVEELWHAHFHSRTIPRMSTVSPDLLPPVLKQHDPPQPRLGIIHLMAWTLGSAMILAIQRAFNQQNLSELPWIHQAAQLTLGICNAFIYGAAVGGVFLWMSRLVRGGPKFPVAAGHWLLLIQGCLALLSWACMGMLSLLQGFGELGFDSGNFRAFLIIWLVQKVVPILLWIAAAVLCSGPTYWRVALGVHAISDALCALLLSLAILSTFGSNDLFDGVWAIGAVQLLDLLPALAVLVAAVLDLAYGVRRDWLHWVGVAIIFAGGIVSILWWLVAMLMARL